MVKYRWKLKSGVLRLPKEVIEAFARNARDKEGGVEIEMTPNLVAAALYPRDMDKRLIIKSLRLIIAELKGELEIEEGMRGT
ncbi:MAG: hypothetical protein ACXQTS_02505 [Candidatus Methanospirareceae archaeon]